MNTSENAPFLINRFVRTGLLKTISILLVVLIGYGYFFLDDHLEWMIESQTSQLLGAEVNLSELHTGWISPSLTLQGLQITNPDQPRKNWVEIESLSARLSGYQLLKMKLVVEDSRLDNVRFGTERSSPGWVSKEGGDARWIVDATESMLTTSLQSQTSGTLLGGGLDILLGEDPQVVLEQYKDKLQAPTNLRNARSRLEDQREQLRQIADNLPTEQELDKLRQDARKLTSSDDNSFSNLVSKRSEIKDLTDRLKTMKSRVNTFASRIDSSSSSLQKELDSLEETLRSDQETLRNQISLSELKLENPTGQLLKGFVRRRLGSLADYLEYAEPYLNQTTDTTPQQTQQPQKQGRDYHFVSTDHTPDFWLQNFEIRAGDSTTVSSYAHGSIRNLSSNPSAVESPLEITLEGRRTARDDSWYRAYLRTRTDELSYEILIDGIDASDWTLSSSELLTLGVQNSRGQLRFEGSTRNNRLHSIMILEIANPEFRIGSSNKGLASQLQQQFQEVQQIQVKARMTQLDEQSITVSSNLDDVLRNSLRYFASEQAEQYKEQIVDRYRNEYRKPYEALQTETNGLISQNKQLQTNKQRSMEDITNLLRSEIKSSPIKLDRFSLPNSSN